MPEFIDQYGERFPYNNLSSEKGYLYEIFFHFEKHPEKIHSVMVYPNGTHIEWHRNPKKQKKITYTNVVPKKLFPNKRRLKPRDLCKIHQLLTDIWFEGKTIYLTSKKIDFIYDEWFLLTRGKLSK